MAPQLIKLLIYKHKRNANVQFIWRFDSIVLGVGLKRYADHNDVHSVPVGEYVIQKIHTS